MQQAGGKKDFLQVGAFLYLNKILVQILSHSINKKYH